MVREAVLGGDPYREFILRWLYAHRGLEGVTVTSWYRDPSHNASVGGSPGSQHQLGLALDTVYRDRATWLEAVRNLNGWGLVAIDEGDHVHAQLWRAGVAAPLVDLARNRIV